VFTPVVLATQETEIRRIVIQSQPVQVVRPYLEKTHQAHIQKGLVEWLKVYALSSNHSTTVIIIIISS
jgi:hypothetical protein